MVRESLEVARIRVMNWEGMEHLLNEYVRGVTKEETKQASGKALSQLQQKYYSFWIGWFFVAGAVLCILECLAACLASTH